MELEGLGELILVDDFSDQETKKLLEKLSHKKLIITHATKDRIGKKYALSEGISEADNEFLLLTDIDCRPSTAKWGLKMCTPLDNDGDIVLGYGGYDKQPGWLNRFIRFETVMTAIQYFSYAIAGIPYMGVGRNIAYKKATYKQLGGFSDHLDVISGDDDLFVQSAYKDARIKVMIDQEAFTYSKPSTTCSEFFLQKTRHVSTSTHYRMIHKFLLGLFALSHISFYTLGMLLLLMGHPSEVMILYLCFLVPAWFIFRLLSKLFKEEDLITWFPFLDFFYFIYMIILVPSFFYKKTKW